MKIFDKKSIHFFNKHYVEQNLQESNLHRIKTFDEISLIEEAVLINSEDKSAKKPTLKNYIRKIQSAN